MTGTIEGYYRGAWPGWSFIPRDVKKEMFETFKVMYMVILCIIISDSEKMTFLFSFLCRSIVHGQNQEKKK